MTYRRNQYLDKTVDFRDPCNDETSTSDVMSVGVCDKEGGSARRREGAPVRRNGRFIDATPTAGLSPWGGGQVYRRLGILVVTLTVFVGVAFGPVSQAAHALPPLNCPPVQSSLSIPNKIESAIRLNTREHTVTLPLYRGVSSGERVWYVLTDTSDLKEAARLGINWSPKLANVIGTEAVQNATLLEGSRVSRSSTISFPGTVDFSGQRVVIPGPHLFPVDPATHAGPIGDAHYSPLFTLGNGIVYNGEQIANPTGIHPKVVTLDAEDRKVTLHLTEGRYLGRKVLYLSTESSDTVVAALENATFAPNLAVAPAPGDDSCVDSAREAIIPIVNGPRGANNPERQGLRSAVAGEGDPLNIIREEPECSDPSDPALCSALQYSPLWDVTPVKWTRDAIEDGLRRRIGSHEVVKRLFDRGLIRNFDPAGFRQMDPEIDGLRAINVVVDCPPMFVAP